MRDTAASPAPDPAAATWIEAPAGAGGYSAPLLWTGATHSPAAASVLVVPALGVPAAYYRRFAEALAARGFDAGVLELRGQGKSALRARHGADWGFRELVQEDLPAALAAIAARSESRRTVLCGHSLGGHLGAIYAGLHAEDERSIAGLVLVATASPYVALYPRTQRAQLRLLTGLLPPLTRVLGHYPGQVLGFGGRESRGTMSDWRALALRGRYVARGITHDLDEAVARARVPALAVHFTEDPLGPERAVVAVCEKLRAAALTRRALSRADLGVRADHFAWAKQPGATADVVSEWIRAALPAAADAVRGGPAPAHAARR